MTYIDLDPQSDAVELEEQSYDGIQEGFPDWVPNEGNLDTWLVKVWSRIASTLYVQAGVVSEEIFKRFGESIIGVPAINAASASVETTWTMQDAAGYTIPAGTQVSIAAAGDTTIGFVTVNEVSVPNGSTVTDTGEVTLSAVVPGAEANGLTADPQLQDALSFVTAIANEGTTSGGVDAEDSVEYLDRLRAQLQTLSLAPILPRDVEILALSVAGIERAVAVDGWDAIAETAGNERTVTVFPIDENGQALATPVKDELDELLQGRREVNFVFYVEDPTYTDVDVAAEITLLPGYTAADVTASVEEAITAYLSPATWGTPDFSDVTTGGRWMNVTKVYRNELIALVDRVPGVDRVVDVELVAAGGTLGTADVTLTGPAPLPGAGTITATV